MVADAQAHGRWHPLGDGYQPQPGDWVVYDGHVEVVTSYADGVLDTIGADSLPGLTVNAHSSGAPLADQGVAGFVDNGNLTLAGGRAALPPQRQRRRRPRRRPRRPGAAPRPAPRPDGCPRRGAQPGAAQPTAAAGRRDGHGASRAARAARHEHPGHPRGGRPPGAGAARGGPRRFPGVPPASGPRRPAGRGAPGRSIPGRGAEPHQAAAPTAAPGASRRGPARRAPQRRAAGRPSAARRRGRQYATPGTQDQQAFISRSRRGRSPRSSGTACPRR